MLLNFSSFSMHEDFHRVKSESLTEITDLWTVLLTVKPQIFSPTTLFESLTHLWSKPLLSFGPSHCTPGLCGLSPAIFRDKCRRAELPQCWCSTSSEGQSHSLLPWAAPVLAEDSTQPLCFLLHWGSVSTQREYALGEHLSMLTRDMPKCMTNPWITQEWY